MKKLLGIVVLGLIIVAQSHAAEKETIVKSLLEQYDNEIASLDEKISKLEKDTYNAYESLLGETYDTLDSVDAVESKLSADVIDGTSDLTIIFTPKEKEVNQLDPLKTEKAKLESEKIQQDIQLEIDITKGREVLTKHAKTISEHSLDLDWDFDVNQGPVGTSETSDLSQLLSKEKVKKINQLDPLKTEKAKSESEKIQQDIQNTKNKQYSKQLGNLTNSSDFTNAVKLFQANWKDLSKSEKATLKSLGWSKSLWKKNKNQLELLKTEKVKLEAEKIRLAVQLNKYIDKKNLEQKIIDTQTKVKKETKTETRKALKKTLSELKKAKKKKKILKKKKKVKKKKAVVKRKPVKKKKIIKRKPVKKKKVIKRKPVKKKKRPEKKRKE